MNNAKLFLSFHTHTHTNIYIYKYMNYTRFFFFFFLLLILSSMAFCFFVRVFRSFERGGASEGFACFEAVVFVGLPLSILFPVRANRLIHDGIFRPTSSLHSASLNILQFFVRRS